MAAQQSAFRPSLSRILLGLAGVFFLSIAWSSRSGGAGLSALVDVLVPTAIGSFIVSVGLLGGAEVRVKTLVASVSTIVSLVVADVALVKLLTPVVLDPPRAPLPDRQQMIDDLKSVYRSIESGNMQRASYYLQIPPDASESEIEEELNGLLDKNEISPEGISILSKRGEFGKLKEVFPDKAERWMDRANISSDRNCYAISYLNAEVAGKWDEDHFVFFRLDDVGKLAENEEDY